MSARDIARETEVAKSLLANMAAVIADDEEARAGTIEGETGLFEAIEAGVARIAEIEALDEAIAARMKALGDRKKRLGNQAELLRAAIHEAMASAELRKIELASATLSLRPTPASVTVLDEADIPSDYWTPQPPKLDRRALLKALKDGAAIPGASLSNGGETLSIRIA